MKTNSKYTRFYQKITKSAFKYYLSIFHDWNNVERHQNNAFFCYQLEKLRNSTFNWIVKIPLKQKKNLTRFKFMKFIKWHSRNYVKINDLTAAPVCFWNINFATIFMTHVSNFLSQKTKIYQNAIFSIWLCPSHRFSAFFGRKMATGNLTGNVKDHFQKS